jgi:hypothetical protein
MNVKIKIRGDVAFNGLPFFLGIRILSGCTLTGEEPVSCE